MASVVGVVIGTGIFLVPDNMAVMLGLSRHRRLGRGRRSLAVWSTCGSAEIKSAFEMNDIRRGCVTCCMDGIRAIAGVLGKKEKDDQIAHRRIVAGRGIPRNHARINNSPATAARGSFGMYCGAIP